MPAGGSFAFRRAQVSEKGGEKAREVRKGRPVTVTCQPEAVSLVDMPWSRQSSEQHRQSSQEGDAKEEEIEEKSE